MSAYYYTAYIYYILNKEKVFERHYLLSLYNPNFNNRYIPRQTAGGIIFADTNSKKLPQKKQVINYNLSMYKTTTQHKEYSNYNLLYYDHKLICIHKITSDT